MTELVHELCASHVATLFLSLLDASKRTQCCSASFIGCHPVHAGIRDLERHVEIDNGEIEVLFLMATEFLISALEGFASVLQFDLGEFCNDSKRTVKALADAHRNG